MDAFAAKLNGAGAALSGTGFPPRGRRYRYHRVGRPGREWQCLRGRLQLRQLGLALSPLPGVRRG